MNNESLPPTVGMKKEGRLILGGYVVPNFHVKMEYIANFPSLSNESPFDPSVLLRARDGENNRSFREGWYFQKAASDGSDPLRYAELNRVRQFVRKIMAILNSDYPIIYKGSRLPWYHGSLSTYRLQQNGDVSIDIERIEKYGFQLQRALRDIFGEPVYSANENEYHRSKQRQKARTALLKSNLNAFQLEKWKYHPNRVTKGTRKFMAEEGLSSYNAFKKAIESNNLYNVNVTAEGVGEAYGPWLNGRRATEENEVANNNAFNGGRRRIRKRKTRRSKRSV